MRDQRLTTAVRGGKNQGKEGGEEWKEGGEEWKEGGEEWKEGGEEGKGILRDKAPAASSKPGM
jgi:hypothetical protein